MNGKSKEVTTNKPENRIVVDVVFGELDRRTLEIGDPQTDSLLKKLNYTDKGKVVAFRRQLSEKAPKI